MEWECPERVSYYVGPSGVELKVVDIEAAVMCSEHDAGMPLRDDSGLCLPLRYH